MPTTTTALMHHHHTTTNTSTPVVPLLTLSTRQPLHPAVPLLPFRVVVPLQQIILLYRRLTLVLDHSMNVVCIQYIHMAILAPLCLSSLDLVLAMMVLLPASSAINHLSSTTTE